MQVGDNTRKILISVAEAAVNLFVAIILLSSLLYLLLVLLFGVDSIEALRNFATASKEIMISLLIIVGGVLILAFLAMFVCWLCKDEDGMTILPFEVATDEDGNSGKAISDLLTAELLRIKQIHEGEAEKIHPIRLESEKFAESETPESEKSKESKTPRTFTKSETLTFPLVVPSIGKLDYKLAEVGAVQVGPVYFQIGPLLAALKQLWPGGDNEQVITGSLQKYGSMINLVAHLEHHEIQSWEVRHKIKPQDGVRDEQIPVMVRDLAFKIAKDLSSEQDGQTNTWQGFKYFTEALDAYHQYSSTEDEKELERAKESCLLAAKAEIGYEVPFNLLYNLGITYLNKEKYVDAERIFKQALEIKSDHALALVELGDVHFAQSNPEDGLKCYYKAKYIDPKCASDWMGKGIALGRLGDYKEVLECFDKATSLDPKYAIAWFNKGIALGRLKRYEKALDCFNKAASLDPENPMFLYNKGVSLEKLGRKEKALECFDKVSALDTKFDFGWIEEGNAFMKKGDIKKAIMCYEKAIIYSKKISLALTLKGNALIKLSDIESAFRCYMNALDIDPGFSIAGIGLMRLGRDITARECFEKAISQNQKDVTAWNGKGSILRIQGKDEDAIKCFRKALEYDPTSIVSYISLIAVYRKLGRKNEIANQAEQFKIAHSLIGLQNEYNRACFEAVSGNTDAALDLLRTSLEKKQEPVLWARRDPDFEFIRDDPRFKALLDEFSASGEKGPE